MASADIARIFATALRQHRDGLLVEAEAGYRAVLGQDPDHVGALAELGRLALQRGRSDIARVLFAKAVELLPANPELRHNFALSQERLDLHGDALANYRLCLVHNPDFGLAFINLGNLLKEQGRLAEAVRAYRCAAVHEPSNWLALNNLGVVLHQMTRDAEATEAYRAALAHCDEADIRHNLSHALLAQGLFAEAWPEYETRRWTPQHAATWPQLTGKRWDGETAAGATLLIHAEQGLGDMLQFCRYVPLAAARGARVLLQVQGPLVRLMSRLPGVAEVVASEGGNPPPFDLYCPMLSLPGIFGTTLETIPAAVPYLSPDPADVANWARRLEPAPGSLRVGLSWAGNPRLPADARRSVPTGMLARLLECPGVAFYSLQKDGLAPPGVADPMGQVRDFGDTAALIANLDLVISVDSAIAHLAGAMGKPVWLLNRFDSEWRWLRGRDDSPWYPTLRQFRQTAPGDWASVMIRVAAALGDETPRGSAGLRG